MRTGQLKLMPRARSLLLATGVVLVSYSSFQLIEWRSETRVNAPGIFAEPTMADPSPASPGPGVACEPQRTYAAPETGDAPREQALASSKAGELAEDDAGGLAIPGVLARLEDIVESCTTATPDLDGLDRIAQALGAFARVDESSIQHFDGTGETLGRLTFPGTELTATFQLSRDGTMSVTLPCRVRETSDYYSRDLKIVCSEVDGRLEGGTLAVQEQFDVRQKQVLESFADQERIVGWVKTTSEREATRAIPIVGTRLPDRSGIRIGHSRGEHAPIVRAWDSDLAPYHGFHALLSRVARTHGR